MTSGGAALITQVEQASGLGILPRQTIADYCAAVEAQTGISLAAVRSVAEKEIYRGASPFARTHDEETAIRAELGALEDFKLRTQQERTALEPEEEIRPRDDDPGGGIAIEDLTPIEGLIPIIEEPFISPHLPSKRPAPVRGSLDDWRLWLVVLFSGALALRLIALGSDNVRMDEAYSWNVVGLSVSEIGYYEVRHPWGYYAVLGRFISVFGDGLWILRLPSVLFSTGAVAVSYLVYRRTGDQLAAIIAGGLLAMAAFSVAWDQEARMYSMLLFFTWLSGLASWSQTVCSVDR